MSSGTSSSSVSLAIGTSSIAMMRVDPTLSSCYSFTICYDWRSLSFEHLFFLTNNINSVSENIPSSSSSPSAVSSGGNMKNILHSPPKHVSSTTHKTSGDQTRSTEPSISTPRANENNSESNTNNNMARLLSSIFNYNGSSVEDGKIMNNIGYIYLHGLFGTPADPIKAVEWFKKSALLGDEFGCFNYGCMLGDGVNSTQPTKCLHHYILLCLFGNE
jgi:hypothetical protein